MPSSLAKSVRYTSEMGTLRCVVTVNARQAWATEVLLPRGRQWMAMGCTSSCAKRNERAVGAVPARCHTAAQPHRTPSGAVAHSRWVVYLEESKPPSTGCAFFTALHGSSGGIDNAAA